MVAALRRFCDLLLQGVCALLMVGLAVMVITAVTMRTLGRSPGWYDEVAGIWLIWLTFFAASLVTLRRTHLGFDGLIKVMPMPLKILAFSISEMMTLLFFAVAAFYGWRVLDIVAGEPLISVPWLYSEVVQSVIPVTAVLMFVSQLVSAPQAWRDLCGKQ